MIVLLTYHSTTNLKVIIIGKKKKHSQARLPQRVLYCSTHNMFGDLFYLMLDPSWVLQAVNNRHCVYIGNHVYRSRSGEG